MSAKPILQTLHLHRDAPEKPAFGQPCTRCGVCCAAEPCPLGRLMFRQSRDACPALEWHDHAYACGLVTAPERYVTWLPHWGQTLARRCFSRWIAAGQGCDSSCEWVA